jgi:hypothetical protein|tara:strand:+ start:90 stop:233 length:144 start_codon:yes stop_codon:yes gene_type:complete
MAVQQVVKTRRDTIKKVTSIGHSGRSMPKNKHKKISWKRYKGQGKRR